MKWIVGLLILLSINTTADAAVAKTKMLGPQGSGGGKGVVCRDSKGRIKSAELLDLWEAKNLYGRIIVQSHASVDQQVQSAIAALAPAFVTFPGNYWYSGSSIPAVPYYEKIFQGTADYFLKSHSTTHWLTDSTLTPTPDSYEQARPNDCGIEQIVTYNDSAANPNILINKDLWDRLDITNRASLIVHESLYAFLRNYGETDSLRTRRTVGFLFAGNQFQSLPSIIPQDVQYCSSTESSPSTMFTQVAIFTNDQGRSGIIPLAILGKPMIGFFMPPDANLSMGGSDLSLMQADPMCNDPNTGAYFTSLTSWGPADTDVSEQLFFFCENGKRVPYLAPHNWEGVVVTATAPAEFLKLSCFSPSSTKH